MANYGRVCDTLVFSRCVDDDGLSKEKLRRARLIRNSRMAVAVCIVCIQLFWLVGTDSGRVVRIEDTRR